MYGNDEDKIKKALASNDDVDRMQRMHRNDIENIPILIILGLFYVATNPEPQMAKYHFMGFTASRVLFSLAYITHCKTRGWWYIGGLATTLSMAVRLLL